VIQQRERLLVPVPVGVTELDRHAPRGARHAPGALEEVFEAGVVAAEAGRQLDQQRAAAVPQTGEAALDARDPCLGGVQPPHVGEGRLERDRDAGRKAASVGQRQ